jgi:hypothetical protein
LSSTFQTPIFVQNPVARLKPVGSVPPFVTELSAEDVAWLQGAGERRRMRAGEEIGFDHLFVVIEGEFESSPAAGGPLRAATDGVVLCVRREEVEAKLARDPAFKRRLRNVISKLAPPQRPESPAEFHVPTVIEKLLEGDF